MYNDEHDTVMMILLNGTMPEMRENEPKGQQFLVSYIGRLIGGCRCSNTIYIQIIVIITMIATTICLMSKYSA